MATSAESAVMRSGNLKSSQPQQEAGATFADDCSAVNQLALEHLLEVLEGLLGLEVKKVGKEVQFLNPLRRDSEFGSCSINSETGLWADFAEANFKGGDVVSLAAKVKGCSQGAALRMLWEYLPTLKIDLEPSADIAAPAGAPDWNKLPILSSTSNRSPKPDLLRMDAASQTASVHTREPVPPCRMTLKDFGLPSCEFIYRNADGHPVAAVLRYDKDGEKTYRTFTLALEGEKGWLWRAGAPAVRPLYNLDKLLARPNAEVIFCEGEKAADAAEKLMPWAVATTTMHGAQSPGKTDFGLLAGRRIIVAPDNDEAGAKYAERVISLARTAGATVQGIFQYPKEVFGKVENGQRQDLPKGYDFADMLAEGWTAEALNQVVDQVSAAPLESGAPAATGQVEAVTQSVVSIGEESLVALKNRFVQLHFNGLLLHDGSGFRAYREGYWPMLQTAVDLERTIGQFLQNAATPSKITQIIELSRMMSSCDADEFSKPQGLICLLNGALDPITGTLLEHDPKFRFANRLEVEWMPAATCELWLRTLDQIFAPDEDQAVKIAFLQEFMGYCLTPDTTMHKFVWMVGRGGNGKSLVLSVLEDLVGSDNVSHAQLDRLQEKFARAELQGKLVNISSEMSAQATVSDGYLKQIVAGDRIEAERKYQPSFSFKPTARLVGATNELPRLLDLSDGFFRRAVILTFNRQFREAEQDRTLLYRLRQELPGILVWAVAGLQRLRQRGAFVVPPSSELALAQYRTDSNPVQQFAEEFLQRSAEQQSWVAAQSLYLAFKDWGVQSGYRCLSIAKFKDRLTALGYVHQRLNSGRFWQAKYVGPGFVETLGGSALCTVPLSNGAVARYAV